MEDTALASESGHAVMSPVHRAILTAHLLTGSLSLAEEAIQQAIDLWNPPGEPEEILFQNMLDAAARAQPEPNPNNSDTAGSYLPIELRAASRLPPRPRRCFGLRILTRWP